MAQKQKATIESMWKFLVVQFKCKVKKKSKLDDKSWKEIESDMNRTSYKLWNVKSEKFVISKDVIADKINSLASKPEMRLQGVIVKNFNKTDENDVFMKSVESQKSDNEKSDIYIKSG